jgi:hypothetical protein
MTLNKVVGDAKRSAASYKQVAETSKPQAERKVDLIGYSRAGGGTSTSGRDYVPNSITHLI